MKGKFTKKEKDNAIKKGYENYKNYLTKENRQNEITDFDTFSEGYKQGNMKIRDMQYFVSQKSKK